MYLEYFIFLVLLHFKFVLSEQCHKNNNCTYMSWRGWESCTTGSKCGGLIRKRVRAICCPDLIQQIDQCLHFCNVTDPWKEFVNSDPRKCQCHSSSLEQCCNGKSGVMCYCMIYILVLTSYTIHVSLIRIDYVLTRIDYGKHKKVSFVMLHL